MGKGRRRDLKVAAGDGRVVPVAEFRQEQQKLERGLEWLIAEGRAGRKVKALAAFEILAATKYGLDGSRYDEEFSGKDAAKRLADLIESLAPDVHDVIGLLDAIGSALANAALLQR